jgi:sec-independent protein translocase protein TatA
MSFGPPELLLVLVIVLIVFGAGKLPQVLGSLGKGVKEFREASEGKDADQTMNAKGTTSTVSTTSAAPSDGIATPGVAAPIPNTTNTAGISTPVATAPPAPAEKTSDTMSTS